jgi:hypothetical protein
MESGDDIKKALLEDDRVDDVVILEHYEDLALVVLVEPTWRHKLKCFMFNRYRRDMYLYLGDLLKDVPEEISVTFKLVL